MMHREFPQWLRTGIPRGGTLFKVEEILEKHKLNTVCKSAKCPNWGECYNLGKPTFLIMGVCTRNCRFCVTEKGVPEPLDPKEPKKIAQAVKELNLRYVVITSVTRDDLKDGGASHFARVVREIHWAASEEASLAPLGRENPRIKVEVLIPDFQGSVEALKIVLTSRPDVLGHNLETVPRLYSKVRPKADYKRSLHLLFLSKVINPKILTKSGLILGLGEGVEEVIETMKDLRKVECDLLTLGQYLAPSKKHLPIARYVPPEEFEILKIKAEELGFRGVASGPLVRSSYYAEELFEKATQKI